MGFFKDFMRGLRFQLVYTRYVFKMFPIISGIFVFLVIISNTLNPIIVWFQKNVISAIEQSIGHANTQGVLVKALVIYFLASFTVLLITDMSSIFDYGITDRKSVV